MAKKGWRGPLPPGKSYKSLGRTPGSAKTSTREPVIKDTEALHGTKAPQKNFEATQSNNVFEEDDVSQEDEVPQQTVPEPKAKRGRGRPKKQVINTEMTTSISDTGPSNRLVDFVEANIAHEDKTTGHGVHESNEGKLYKADRFVAPGAGQLPEHTSPEDVPLPTVEAPAKRGRGRPRKSAVTPGGPSVGTKVVTQPTRNSPDSSSSFTPINKRTTVLENLPSPTPVAKRRRGRPRKIVIATLPSTSTETTAALDEELLPAGDDEQEEMANSQFYTQKGVARKISKDRQGQRLRDADCGSCSRSTRAKPIDRSPSNAKFYQEVEDMYNESGISSTRDTPMPTIDEVSNKDLKLQLAKEYREHITRKRSRVSEHDDDPDEDEMDTDIQNAASPTKQHQQPLKKPRKTAQELVFGGPQKVAQQQRHREKGECDNPQFEELPLIQQLVNAASPPRPHRPLEKTLADELEVPMSEEMKRSSRAYAKQAQEAQNAQGQSQPGSPTQQQRFTAPNLQKIETEAADHFQDVRNGEKWVRSRYTPVPGEGLKLIVPTSDDAESTEFDVDQAQSMLRDSMGGEDVNVAAE